MATRYDGYSTGETGIRESVRPNGAGEVEHLRADIQETRERMSHTVEDIGERLNPDRLKSQLKHNLRDATIGKAEHMARAAADRVDDARHGIMDTIRDNPIPAAMVGIGLGWLLVNGRRHEHEEEYTLGNRWSEDYGEGGTYRPLEGSYDWGADDSGSTDVVFESEFEFDVEEGRMQRAKDRVGEIAHDAREKVGEFRDKAQDAISDARSRVMEKGQSLRRGAGRSSHRVEDRFESALRDNPLAVGAAAAAIGLAIGLTAPTTRRESELMGPVRDRIIDRAKHATQEATHKVRDVASHVKQRAQETARDDLGLT